MEMMNGIPKALIDKFLATPKHREGDCVIWDGPNIRGGYGKVSAGGNRIPAHVLAYAMSHGSPSKNYVLHSCDTPPCVNPSHLRDGTQSENVREMHAKGRCDRKGEKHVNAKLTEKDVLAIRNDFRYQNDIALDYGVCQKTISRIKCRENWSHINA